MTDPIFCQTIGLEIEVTNVNLHEIRLPMGWNVTDDASVTTDVTTLNGIPTTDHTDLAIVNSCLNRQTLGGELVSSIIDPEQPYLHQLKSICSDLITAGEPDRSRRAGLHVHLSFTSPKLEMLKTIMILGAHLEDVFFLLGGMGYEFRGMYNDASYCRPITTPGPQVINDDDGNLLPCFVLEDLLESTSVHEFKHRLGDYGNQGDNRYVPIRYHWLNLWNLWQHKRTLEFRIFNHTLKPRYIELAIEVCRAFGDAVLYYSYNLEERDSLPFNSVYAHRDKEAIKATFVKFANGHMDDRKINLALQIMDTVPINSIRLPDIPFYFHLRFHRHNPRQPILWIGSSYRPSIRYRRNEVERPHFEDIHNVRANEGSPNYIPDDVAHSFEDPRRPFRTTGIDWAAVRRTTENITSTARWNFESSNREDQLSHANAVFDEVAESGEMVSWEFVEANYFTGAMIEWLQEEGLIEE